jgi:ferric-dicitrate binding protein FerR (iron transport regulator)
MGATGRSSTYRRWRRRTDSSSVLHLLAAAHFLWLLGSLQTWRGGEGRGSEAQGEVTVGERSREGAPEQHCSRGAGEE